MIKDQLADFLTRVRNASLQKHACVFVTKTHQNLRILNLLIKENYIKGYLFLKSSKARAIIKVVLSYDGWWIKKPIIRKVKQYSKSSETVFVNILKLSNLVTKSKSSSGLYILTTSSGVVSGQQALHLKKGGKLLCSIN